MPIGIYKIQDGNNIVAGDFVSVCLPDQFAEIGIERGYITHGNCKNGSSPLIKEVIAVPGDRVAVQNNQIIVNGITFLAPRFTDDRKGNLISKIKDGDYGITNLYWVYGEHDKTYSWDSRYFGGIPKTDIIGKAKPILLFN